MLRRERKLRSEKLKFPSVKSRLGEILLLLSFFSTKSEGRRPFRCKMGHDTSSKQHNLSR